MRKRLSKENYLNGILNNDRVILSKAISLFESTLSEDKDLAGQILQELHTTNVKSLRIGISGIPGAGKSTFIEGFGKFLTSLGRKIAVLTIDPSSTVSKGSILGDKTRMETLSLDPLALIRSSPSNAHLGGIAMYTKNLVTLCEAAGYEIIIIETVGTGQSEGDIKQISDLLVLLTNPGGGDELQGMKKGIGELTDIFIINKADGTNLESAQIAQQQLINVIQLSNFNDVNLIPEVLLFSSTVQPDFAIVWESINKRIEILKNTGIFDLGRRKQGVHWMNEGIKYKLLEIFYNNPIIQKSRKTLESEILSGKITGDMAASELIKIFKFNN